MHRLPKLVPGMPSDYEAILKENLYAYGHEVSHLEVYSHLYSDRTHFIFELVQNAEDAGASEISFSLFPDRLEISHNGRPFTEEDVRAITAVGKSTKADDLTKIGKFGLGFKAVYAYTSSPHIHSGDEHFLIKSYTRPEWVPPVSDLPASTTLTIIPFNRSNEQQDPAREIAAALKQLDLGTLLFLNKIATVTINDTLADENSQFERVTEGPTDLSCRRVLLNRTRNCSDDDVTAQDEEWLIWHRNVGDDGRGLRRVEIAFQFTTTADGNWQFKPQSTSPLVVFFPTEKETRLGFRLQGPYRTTPARDNVASYDPWNKHLVTESAQLLGDILVEMRDVGMLTADMLSALPISSANFNALSMFRPIFESIRNLFHTTALIPDAGGGFSTADEVVTPSTNALRKLFGGEGLPDIDLGGGPLKWISSDVAGHVALRDYLAVEIGVKEMTLEGLALSFDAAFLEAQTDDWICSLIHLLHAYKSLFGQRSSSTLRTTLNSMPLIRLEDGRHVLVRNSAGSPSAYLPPSSGQTSLPTVRLSIAKDATACQFLQSLGVTEPDAVAEVIGFVLPRYRTERSFTEHDEDQEKQRHQDLAVIEGAWSSAPIQRREQLGSALRSAAIVRAVNPCSGEEYLVQPGHAIQPSPELDMYFVGHQSVRFTHRDQERWFDLFRRLGMRSTVPITHEGRPDQNGNVTISYHPGHHKRGLDGFDPSAHAFGLKNALRTPNPARSRFIWNEILVKNRKLLQGVVESCTRQSYTNAERSSHFSELGELARTSTWIPDASGEYRNPSTMRFEDLPAGYERNQVVARAMGMRMPIDREVADAIGLSIEEVEAIQSHPELAAALLEHPEALVEFARSKGILPSAGAPGKAEVIAPAGDVDEADEIHNDVPVSFVSGLRSSFDRPGRDSTAAEGAADLLSDGRVPAPALRRERTREALAAAKASEPAVEDRFRVIPTKVWERDDGPKIFMLEQYNGECQLCGFTFPKRNGKPYFEGLYLVRTAHARWMARPGAMLCLCANCSSRMQFGAVMADNLIGQIVGWRTAKEGGSESHLRIEMAGQPALIRYTEKHLLDLQELVLADAATDGA